MTNKYLEKIAMNRYVQEIVSKFPAINKGGAKYLSLKGVSPSTLSGGKGFAGTGLHNKAVPDVLARKKAVGHGGRSGPIKLYPSDRDSIMNHLKQKVSLPG